VHEIYTNVVCSAEWIEHMKATCPHCGQRPVVDDKCSVCGSLKSSHKGPFGEGPIIILAEPEACSGKVRTVRDSGAPTSARTSDFPVTVTPGESAAEGYATDTEQAPERPPALPVPLPTQSMVERVLAPIEARAKKRRKTPEGQGSLF
jgi:hypothetical protein